VFMTLTACAKKIPAESQAVYGPPLFSDCDEESSLFCDEDLDDLPECNESDESEEKECSSENLRSSP